jgi:hypothetical protein
MLRKWGLFLAWVFTVVTVASASAAADDVAYLGNTPGTLKSDGNSGVLRFQQLCDLAFPGEDARMCTSEEIIRNAGGLPRADTDNLFQWVHPSIVVTVGTLVVDFSGVQATAANLTCNGWSSEAATVTGLRISNLGLFSLGPCSGNHEITCCAALPDVVP